MLPARSVDIDGENVDDGTAEGYTAEHITLIIGNDDYSEEELRERYEEGSFSPDYEPEFDEEGNEIAYEWPEEAPRRPLDWANSAAIVLDEEEDAIHVKISCGDPRGAFCMTVRRLPDGTLMLYHPYPGEGFAHRETVEIQRGALQIK